MRSDNAKELALTEFLQNVGVVHQFSFPHRPQQNSVVERRHQHLLNVARALMFQAQLPIYFWGECVSTTAYIINRTPSSNMQNQSPYDLLYGKVPAYDLMKAFGCLCYAATIPTQRHKSTPQPPPEPEPQLEIKPDLAQPDVQPNAHVRRSTRVTRPPTHLRDYVSDVTYPIQNHLTYGHLSPTYRDYVFKV